MPPFVAKENFVMMLVNLLFGFDSYFFVWMAGLAFGPADSSVGRFLGSAAACFLSSFVISLGVLIASE